MEHQKPPPPQGKTRPPPAPPRVSQRNRRLPPLNLFRAFEAAARHSSFTIAAEELLVTQSAISQQIRQLEEFLDVRLFRRLPRGLELTREGTALRATVSEALNMMARACSKLSDPSAPAVLCVNAAPAFASSWLAPRLKGFMEQNPNIKVTLLASSDPVAFNRQDIDVAIRWGKGTWENMHAEKIVDEALIPVCSPSLFKHHQSISHDELAGHTLLQVLNQPDWTAWLEKSGLSGKPFRDTLYFSDANLMIAAAVQGQGICFTTLLLAHGELVSGRLARLSDIEVETDEGYYFLCSSDMVHKSKIAAFREWLMTEAAHTVEEGDRLTRFTSSTHATEP
jgi:LysR family glycine cleavage system transcriptional activator